MRVFTIHDIFDTFIFYQYYTRGESQGINKCAVFKELKG